MFALNAVLFLRKDLLDMEVDHLPDLKRAQRQDSLSTALPVQEANHPQ